MVGLMNASYGNLLSCWPKYTGPRDSIKVVFPQPGMPITPIARTRAYFVILFRKLAYHLIRQLRRSVDRIHIW